MIKENIEGVKHTCVNENENGVITAIANFSVLNKEEFIEFANWLIQKEIKDIREFEDVEDMSNEEILVEFKDNFTEINSMKEKILDLDKIVYLDNIQNTSLEKYAAREIVDYLKEKYNKIILYSIEDAVTYWKNNNFNSIYRDEYYGFNF